MRKVEFLDTTLRDGKQTLDVSFSIREKVAIAKQFEKWGIASIEAGFPAASPDPFEAVRQIPAATIAITVSGLARSVKSGIDACYEALKDVKHSQCHMFIATSPIHHEHKLKRTKKEILDITKERVAYACSRFDVVEFSPEDAARTELDYLLQVVQTAADVGITHISIPDTAGLTTLEEYGNIFKYPIEDTKSDREIIFSPHRHDDLGMATANTLVAIRNGTGRVEGTVNGIGECAGNVALKEIVVALNIREDYYRAASDIILNEMVNTSELISRFSETSTPKNKAVVGGSAFLHESGIHQDGALKNPLTYEIITPELIDVKHNSFSLGKLPGRHTFVGKLKELELVFEESEIAALFSKFKKLVDEKYEITDADIRALVTGTETENLGGFHLGDLKLTSDADNTMTAEVLMINVDGEEAEVITDGEGSVEAVHNTVDKLSNQTARLLNYTMDTVTDGVDSQVRVSVSVENADTGTVFNTSGIGFDMLRVGVIACVSANAFAQRENAGEADKAVLLRDIPTD